MGFPFPVDEAQGGGADAREVFVAWHQVGVCAYAARAGGPGVTCPRVPLVAAMAGRLRPVVARAPVAQMGRVSSAPSLVAAGTTSGMASGMASVTLVVAASVEAAAPGAPRVSSPAVRVVADPVLHLGASDGLAERR